MNRKEFRIIILIIFVLIIPFLIFFYYNFRHQVLSNNIADWGSFGDYLGGTLNTFLSLLILIATIYIAYQINKFDEVRNEKNIEFEKRKLLREFREIEYKSISEDLNKLWEIISNPNRIEGLNGIFIIYHKYSDFLKYKNHLFQNLDTKEFTELQDFLHNTHKYYCDNEKIILEEIPQIIRMSEFIDKFHLKLQKSLIEN